MTGLACVPGLAAPTVDIFGVRCFAGWLQKGTHLASKWAAFGFGGEPQCNAYSLATAGTTWHSSALFTRGASFS